MRRADCPCSSQTPSRKIRCSRRGLPLAVPDDVRPDFSVAVFRAEFAEGRSLSDEGVLSGILASLGLPAAEFLQKAKSDPVRALLREETETAQKLGLFGAPSFVTPDGEIFWGDDRLEQALDWAKGAATQMSLLPELTTEEVERYARHIVLRDIGGPGQRKLKAAHVVVIGAGRPRRAVAALSGGGGRRDA